MKYSQFVPDCAQAILVREGKELPGDLIAAIAIDEDLYESECERREDKIRSLLGTLHSEITRGQASKPPSQHIFYRTPKRPHPETGRMVYHFGLTEWNRSGNGRADLNGRARTTGETRMTIALDQDVQDSVKVLVASGKARTEAEALAWLAEQGREARKEYLSDLKSAVELLTNVRDSVS
jgi:hypothetical protein